MTFAPKAGRCKKCHVYVGREDGLVFIHELNGCEHQGKVAFTGSLEFMELEKTKEFNDWIEWMA